MNKKKLGIGCLSIIGIFIIIVIIGASLGNSKTNNTENTNNNESKQEGPAWTYSTEKDKINSSSIKCAQLTSTNSIDQEFPYSSTSCTITVRDMKNETNVMIEIENGQILDDAGGIHNNNYVLVKFDNKEPKKYYFDSSESLNSEIVFLRKTKDFINNAKHSKNILIELPLYQVGRPTFEFQTSNYLEWQ